MKHRHIHACRDLEQASAALAAAREAGVEQDDLSLVARADIEIEQLPDSLLEARKDSVPAALRGVAGGGAVGVVAGLLAVAVPPLGITLAGGALIAATGALMGGWAGSLVGTTVEDPVRRQFEEAIEAGRILVVVDAEPELLQATDVAIARTGATPLPYDAPSVVS